MEYSEINPSTWKEFFDYVSQTTLGQETELKVSSIELGDQTENKWSASEGLTYEPLIDTVYVHFRDTNHAIVHPRRILLGESDGLVRAVCIQDAEGKIETLEFRRPKQLRGTEGHRYFSSPGPIEVFYP